MSFIQGNKIINIEVRILRWLHGYSETAICMLERDTRYNYENQESSVRLCNEDVRVSPEFKMLCFGFCTNLRK